MDSYYNINNTYSNNGIINNSTDELEKMARRVNAGKKNNSNDIYNKYRKKSEPMIDTGIDTSIGTSTLNTSNKVNNALYNMINVQSTDKGTAINPPYFLEPVQYDISSSTPAKKNNSISPNKMNGFFSAQGDYTEFKKIGDDDRGNETINDNKNLNHKKYKTEHHLLSDDDSKIDNLYNLSGSKSDDHHLLIDTPSNSDDLELSSDSSDSSFSSSLTFTTKDIDNHVKSQSKFDNKKKSKRHKCIDFDLNSVDSLESLDSGESLLRHLRFCKECKDRVILLIKKSRAKKKDFICIDNLENKSNTMRDQIIKTDRFTDHTVGLRFPEIKEIVTVCLIGFLIIIILDLLMKNK